MRLSKPTSILPAALISLILLGVLGVVSLQPARGYAAGQPDSADVTLPQLTPTAPPTSQIFLPLAARLDPNPAIELLASWIVDSTGAPKTVFLPNDAVKYTVYVGNNTNSEKSVAVGWTQSGPCGETSFEAQSVKFPPGINKHEFEAQIPNCQGVQSNLSEVTYEGETSSIEIQHVITSPFHGFDMCSLPTVSQMQTWWNQSPYYTINLYIGGDSRACAPANLNQTWLSQVSQQGWTYLLTWVGPQAPCTGFKTRMSWDAATAKSQGRQEADKAVVASKALGFDSDHIIYYDMEGYASKATSTCIAAVDAFMQGWVERIHELEYRAGAYGGACSSLVADWWDNASPPDDIWLAHWYVSPFFYSREAHVWNTPCVDNSLWPKNQRLKQYAGDHLETWGGVGPFAIDSNVLDGEVTTFLAGPAAQGSSLSGSQAESSAVPFEPLVVPEIRAMELLSPQVGWALRGQQLIRTEDGGASWQDLTPVGFAADNVLGVDFLDADLGWVVGRAQGKPGAPGLFVLRTSDGGASWQSSALPLSPEEAASIASAAPHFLDVQNGWIALKVQSGINFSLGRLFATQDGGLTWVERALPLGEAVRFVDPARGWVVGGPGGGQLFHTQDGGLSWEAQILPLTGYLAYDSAYIGLPQFRDARNGYLPVTLVNGDTSRLVLFETSDGGATWHPGTTRTLGGSSPPARTVPFSLEAGGGWWAAGPDAGRLYRASPDGAEAVPQSAGDFPGDVLALDFTDSETGWVLAQEGICSGTKLPYGESLPPGSEPLRCQSTTRLLSTINGGNTWSELTPPGR